MADSEDEMPDVSISIAMDTDGSTAVGLLAKRREFASMPPADAQSLAIALLTASFIAETDAQLYTWFVEAMNMPPNQARLSVQAFRKFCGGDRDHVALLRTAKTKMN